LKVFPVMKPLYLLGSFTTCIRRQMNGRNRSSIRSVNSKARNDDVFLVAFNMRGEQTFDFIPTFDQLQKHLAQPDKREPYSLYDAVYLASDRIQSSRNRKRVLLIISDSADHHAATLFQSSVEKCVISRPRFMQLFLMKGKDMDILTLRETAGTDTRFP